MNDSGIDCLQFSYNGCSLKLFQHDLMTIIDLFLLFFPQVLTEQKVNIEQAKSQFEIQRMQTEAEIKRMLMAEEFNYNVELARANRQTESLKEKEIEDRKDKRIKMEGTQQSEMIQQRQTDGPPKNFESSNDSIGDFGLEAFSPR